MFTKRYKNQCLHFLLTLTHRLLTLTHRLLTVRNAGTRGETVFGGVYLDRRGYIDTQGAARRQYIPS